MSNRLLRECPFCGSKAKLRRKNRTIIGGVVVRNTYVYCPMCDSRGGRILYNDFDSNVEAESEAIKLWNRRSDGGYDYE